MGDPKGPMSDKLDEKADELKYPGNEEGHEIERDGCKIQVAIPKGVDYDITLKNINFEVIVNFGSLIAIIIIYRHVSNRIFSLCDYRSYYRRT